MPTQHIEHAYAKLTRTLRMTGLRDDGFHLLESEMVTLDLADELVIADGEELIISDEIAWVGNERTAPSSIPTGADNLVARALVLSGKKASVRLTKRIPSGAGLGGGSADAAAIFRWANMSDLDVAASLGSDVPFCIAGGRARVTGVGEELAPMDFEDRTFILLTPELSVSTPAVYAAFDTLDVKAQHSETSNDLEAAALLVQPQLRYWRDLLEQVTGRSPVLAGSGSTWFVDGDDEDVDNKAVVALRQAAAQTKERACVSLCHTVPAISINS